MRFGKSGLPPKKNLFGGKTWARPPNNSGEDWDDFCTNTAHTARNAKKAHSPPGQLSKHKTYENKGLLASKLLMQENPHHFVIFPIHHADRAEEIHLSADLTDWNRLSKTELHFISHVLAFFATSDGTVNKNLYSKFITKVTAPEARSFYGF